MTFVTELVSTICHTLMVAYFDQHYNNNHNWTRTRMKTKMKTNVTMTTTTAMRVGEGEQGQGLETQTCLEPQVFLFYLFFILY